MLKPDYLSVIRILQDMLAMCVSHKNFSFETAESMLLCFPPLHVKVFNPTCMPIQ